MEPGKAPTASSATETLLTQLLIRWREGEVGVVDDIIPIVYAELRRLAQYRLRLESATLTLQATELVHEAYFRLLGKNHPIFNDRAHFLAVASLLMRRVLVDHARRKRTERKGGGKRPGELDERLPGPWPKIDWILVDQLLNDLTAFDPRKGRIVELKFFGGLTVSEIAGAVGISEMTVVREWRMGRAWLQKRLAESGGPNLTLRSPNARRTLAAHL